MNIIVWSIRNLINFIRCNLLFVIYSLLFIFSVWPTRFAYHYDFIPVDQLLDHFVPKTTANISLQSGTKCDYYDILNENVFMYKAQYQSDIFDSTEIRLGGEYYPEDCVALFSTAIIVPYRQREKQLNQFLIYMHNFLRKQNIHYRIFVVEQFDSKPFNRAKLLNIGSMYATKLGFPCVILHDVDLLPMNLGQLYTCTKEPRHMCASLDKFRFNLPYRTLFGGAVAIQSEIFAHINGMSNLFQGWGGEDDDLYERINSRQINICRFPPSHSQYTMLNHALEKKNEDRMLYLLNGPMRYNSDGLNSLAFKEKSYKLHNLFTHILVTT